MSVNHLARKARQSRVFSKGDKFKFYARKLNKLAVKFFPASKTLDTDGEALYLSSSQVFKKSLALSTALLLCTSVSANVLSDDYYASAALEGSMPMEGVIISDSDGYLTKISPQIGNSDRSKMTDKATHVVASGETLSHIAARYGVSTQTIVWENDLPNVHSLRVGQTLSIPPVNGVTHTVKKGQSLGKIAEMYDVEASLIASQNGLDSETVVVGQELIVPGGKKIIPVQPRVVAQTAPRAAVSRGSVEARTVSSASLESANTAPAAGKMFIFPTRGKITQYFHRGHYAYDIADVSRPPVWSAAAGTVEKVSVGSWGGGYGNHIIVDHGNGYKTLYAHLGSVSVSKGQAVNQGDPLGQMGNTGRVYGRTGIHLHFEVRHNGVKKNPGSFF